MKADIYNQNGEKTGQVELASSIFEVEGSPALVHRYLVYQQANARRPIAHTLTRSHVRGGGRKPFRQKGTGNARQGSKRNIHMKGGGVAFGPSKDRNFSLQMPKKMRRKALFTMLSTKAKDGKILALESFEPKEVKTKTFAALASKLPMSPKFLVVSTQDEKALQLASRNMAKAKTIFAGYLNPMDLLKYDEVLFTKAALDQIHSTYSN